MHSHEEDQVRQVPDGPLQTRSCTRCGNVRTTLRTSSDAGQGTPSFFDYYPHAMRSDLRPSSACTFRPWVDAAGFVRRPLRRHHRATTSRAPDNIPSPVLDLLRVAYRTWKRQPITSDERSTSLVNLSWE